MPELPEVETVCRGLRPILKGNAFKRVVQRRPDLRIPFPQDFVTQLEGQAVVDIRRRAKYLQILLDSDVVLIIHLGMSGRILIEDEKTKTETYGSHDHVIFHMKSGHQIRYHDPRRFGLMTLCDQAKIDQHKMFAHLGPEPLENEFNPESLALKLAHKKTPIKSALLDQRVVAGLGNIYVCEGLYRARINPLRLAQTLTAQELKVLVPELKAVLREAIESGGSTLKDYAGPDGELGYFQFQFQVYNQEGNPCSACGQIIKRIVQSGRSTFYCPRCQV